MDLYPQDLGIQGVTALTKRSAEISQPTYIEQLTCNSEYSVEDINPVARSICYSSVVQVLRAKDEIDQFVPVDPMYSP